MTLSDTINSALDGVCPVCSRPGFSVFATSYGDIVPDCQEGCDFNALIKALAALGYPAKDPDLVPPVPPEDSQEEAKGDHADRTGSFEAFQAKTLSEWLLEPEVPPNPLLYGVFDRGDKVVIIGKSKTRKSFFAMQLALCLSTARSFLEFNALEKVKVLIVQSEIKSERYHSRCIRMAERMGISADELSGLLVVNARGCADLPQLLEDSVVAHKPDLVIVDPFYKLIAGDENKSEDVKPILRFFDSLAERTGAAVIYVHHDKKGSAGDSELTDRGSGSGVLARDFDSAIFLAAHETGDDQLVVEFITRNYQSPAPFSAEFMNYCFVRSGSAPKKKTSKTAAKGIKSRLPELVTLAIRLVGCEYRLGVRRIPMATFNAKLDDIGIGKNVCTAVKEDLLQEGYIEVEKRKAQKGESPLTVLLLKDDSAQMHSDEFRENSGDDLGL